MRTVIYKCDLCREEKPHIDLKTVIWTTCKDGKYVPGQFVLTDVNTSDRMDKQICNECIKMIKNY